VLKIGLTVGAARRPRDRLLAVATEEVRRTPRGVREARRALQAQLKAIGISYKAHAKQIDEVIQKHSRLAGLDDEDLQDAFTNLVRSTGKVNSRAEGHGLVADLARAKHIDVAKAGELVAKVHAGNTGVLKRYGIAFDPVTKPRRTRSRRATKHATDEQIRAAKEADKQPPAQKPLALCAAKFSGQAEAYGKTTAGAMERAGVAVGEPPGDRSARRSPGPRQGRDRVRRPDRQAHRQRQRHHGVQYRQEGDPGLRHA
jgi:hypothetical protein